MWMSKAAKEANPNAHVSDWTEWPEAPASVLPAPKSQLEGLLFPAATQPGGAGTPQGKQATRFRDMLNRRRQLFLAGIQRGGA